ncbi:helix-turn-helix domain-containing protein [Streptomyces daghestanicus]|uniref:Transcriptional regulator n=1 Tax=Streptomyces daghestanicus TaxID=66885 RepID=A0ABQ3Q3S6_9ACTN|nr:helix-turn-helix transcriptional regulator [Streptomyces daghestanicus]GGU28398.1 transcriptional regulator [Streptomyces daghestanicus]GHI31931.1 transcriptional regulator [Streptomyces daghestanicus]
MAPRSNPTARQIRLGAELRKLRVAAGLKAREVAAFLDSTSAQMSQIEAGISGVSAERVRRLANHYECEDEAFVDALATVAEERSRGWWDDYRGVLPQVNLDVAEAEHHATFMREVVITYVPGLLQTPDYARAVFRYMRPDLTEAELAPRVEHRMMRRRAIEGDKPTPYETIVHEFALRIRVSDRRTSLSQLQLILEEIERGHAVVRVIPVHRDGFPGADASMMYLGGRVPKLDTGLLDSPTGTLFIDAEEHLNRLRTLFRTVRESSLEPLESRDFIHRLMKEL